MLSAIRPIQWSKNLLVFVPVVVGHELGDPEKVASSALAFLSFCLVASAGYLINDLRDREFDREHPVKRMRAIASGALPSVAAVAGIVVLLVLGFGIAASLGARTIGWIAAYAAVTVGYTLVLKRLAIVDVLALAGAYAIRLMAGGAASRIVVSEWLLAFSMFFFLSLAFTKRYGDVRRRAAEGVARLAGRAYGSEDIGFLQTAGVSAGYLSVLVFALYLNSDQVRALYADPGALWFISPVLLYWTTRMWLLVHRGDLDEDPILFSVRDPVSYVAVTIIAVLFVIAL